MKNFYDSTIIRKNLLIDIEIILVPIDKVNCTLTVNNENKFSNILDQQQLIKAKVHINDPINIKLDVERQHPGAIDLSIRIDNIDIIPNYQLHATPKTSYIDYTGSWILKIQNFYQWHHKITGQGWIA